MNLRDATILVTGANGFVGPYVVRALAARGARVLAMGEALPGVTLPVESWLAGDLRDPASLERVVAAAAPDAIVHLAGQASAARSFEAPVETFHVNALGTWRLLEAARIHAPRARVLAVTSGEIYGAIPEGTRAGEDAPIRPVSPYGLSKAAADAYAEIAAVDLGQDVIRARAFGHTGPGQEPRFMVPSMAQQIAAIERGDAEAVLRVGNLDAVRDLTDVRDVADAYVALLERGRTGAAYNVCRGEGVRLSQLVEGMCATASRPIRIERDPARMRPADVPYLVGDPDAIARDVGWRVALPLERTLEDVLKDWRRRTS